MGTGFHPELTGRENIFLNGSILGMKKVEIDRKFDEIVDFSGVEQFLDTPVKRYSSGMYVRLAFAVAAHLEPEILIVDEVLAVGDAEFQKKCLGQDGAGVAGGRSDDPPGQPHHGLDRSPLRSGHLPRSRSCRTHRYGARDRLALPRYGGADSSTTGRRWSSGPTGQVTGRIRLTSFHIEDESGCPVTHVASGRDVTFVFGYEALGD